MTSLNKTRLLATIDQAWAVVRESKSTIKNIANGNFDSECELHRRIVKFLAEIAIVTLAINEIENQDK